MLPLLPFYAQHFVADAFAIGLLVAVFSFCQFIAAPLLGRWSDHHGRRPLLAISQFGTMAGLILLALAPSLTMVFAARIIGGLDAGNMSVASALGVDRSTPGTRKQAIGVVSAGVGVGLVAGPALSALFAGMSLAAPIWAACGLSGLSAVATLMLLPRIHHMPKNAPPRAAGSILKMVSLFPVLAVLFAFLLAFAMYTSVLAVVAHARVVWNARPLGPREIWWLFTLSGAINIAVQLLAMRKVSSFFSDRVLSIGSFVVLAGAFLLLGIATTAVALLIVVAVAAIASAIVRPVVISTLTLARPSGGQGTLMGMTSSLMAGANIIGPVLAGALLARAHTGMWAAAMLALCAAGAFTAAGLVKTDRVRGYLAAPSRNEHHCKLMRLAGRCMRTRWSCRWSQCCAAFLAKMRQAAAEGGVRAAFGARPKNGATVIAIMIRAELIAQTITRDMLLIPKGGP